MADRIRLFLDQHIPLAVAQGLRRRGVDILTAHEANRCGISDPEQLALAQVDGRVVVTFDRDFLALAASEIGHAGIAILPGDQVLDRRTSASSFASPRNARFGRHATTCRVSLGAEPSTCQLPPDTSRAALG